MLKNKLPIVVAVLFLLVGCSSSSKEKERILIKNNQGIFFNVDNELYPVYSLETLNSSEVGGEVKEDERLKEDLLEIFYNGKQESKIPVNELVVNSELKLLLNKNFKKPVKINAIYFDGDRTIIIPFEWEDNNYVQFDINNLKKDIVYNFQISYMKQDEGIVNDIETYFFSVLFK